MTPDERKRAIWQIGLTFASGMGVWLVGTYALGPVVSHFGGSPNGWAVDIAAIPFGWAAAWLCWQLTGRVLGP